MPTKTLKVKIPHQPQPIDGAITLPANYVESDAKNFHLVILTHGAGGDMNNDFLKKLAEALATNGILCLRFTCISLNLAVRVKAFHAALKFAQKSYPVKSVIV
jgi:predicted alpha/beta-fold hydrolase